MSHYLSLPLSLIFLTASVSLSSAESRPWKNVDGSRSIQGEFVKRDATRVTVRDANHKEITIELVKLHPDELKWLDLNATDGLPVSDPAAVFDSLKFGDDREVVLSKLKASEIVEMTTDETFIGRSGLNGVFRTRQKIGTLSALLYFDWTVAGKLKEITLQSESVAAGDYDPQIRPSWQEFVNLLSTLYGKPVQSGPLPSIANIADGSFSPSHLWKLEAGGNALLGTSREGAKFQVVVRFTMQKIQPVEIP